MSAAISVDSIDLFAPVADLGASKIRASRRFVVLIWLSLLSGGLAGCAGVPDIPPEQLSQTAAASPSKIMGARGALTPRQSKALLDRIETEAGDAGMLDRHLAIEQEVAESPLVAGNRTRILRDGDESFATIFAAIRDAKHHLNLEYYILEDIENGGVSLGDLLLAKRKAGVMVSVSYDSFGSSDTPAEFFDRLREGGVNVLEFNPINPLDAKVRYSLNERNHRKILVVDGVTAVIGGVNLSRTYQANPLSRSGPTDETPVEHWRDTAMKIDGPVVAQVQALFVEHWRAQQGPTLSTEGFFPTIEPRGDEIMRIIGSTPEKETPRYYVTLVSAIRNAEKRIDLTNAYFVPTEQTREGLMDAARRGVTVRLLLPDRSDSPLALSVGRSHYTELLEAGVQIYESQGIVLHSKTVVIDGVWSVIGSSNIDPRSAIINAEVDAVVLGRETAQEMESMFEEDLAQARQIDLAEWRRRPLIERIGGVLARVWRNLL